MRKTTAVKYKLLFLIILIQTSCAYGQYDTQKDPTLLIVFDSYTNNKCEKEALLITEDLTYFDECYSEVSGFIRKKENSVKSTIPLKNLLKITPEDWEFIKETIDNSIICDRLGPFEVIKTVSNEKHSFEIAREFGCVEQKWNRELKEIEKTYANFIRSLFFSSFN